MSIAIDAVILITVLITIIVCAHRGFIKSVLGFGKFYISLALANFYKSTLSNCLSTSSLGLSIRDLLLTKVFSLTETVDEVVLSSVVNAICDVLAFGMIFIVSFLILFVICVILNRIFELKPLKSINTFAGFCLGVLVSVVNVFIFIVIAKLILSSGLIESAVEIEENTVLYKLICNMDIFSYINQCIK